MNTDEEQFITSHIRYIRNMSALDDGSLKALLKLKITEDPSILEKFKDNQIKRQMDDIRNIAKNIRTEPEKLGRLVA